MNVGLEIAMQWKTLGIVFWFLLMLMGQIYLARIPNLYQTYGRTRVIRNIGLLFITAILSPIVVIPLTLFAAENTLAWRPDTFPLWADLIINIIILDGFIYGWHRLCHRIPFLWYFHEVHHLDQRLDVTTAFRFHGGEVLLSAMVRVAVIIIFDIDLLSVIFAETLLLMASLFHHANWRLPKKLDNVLGWIFVTPDWHLRHHENTQLSTNANFGNIFSFWDRIFGTAKSPIRQAIPGCGVAGIGTDFSFIKLNFRPFYRLFHRAFGRIDSNMG